jgi:hypothetical protein
MLALIRAGAPTCARPPPSLMEIVTGGGRASFERRVAKAGGRGQG